MREGRQEGGVKGRKGERKEERKKGRKKGGKEVNKEGGNRQQKKFAACNNVSAKLLYTSLHDY
jgi:hypothetical protein